MNASDQENRTDSTAQTGNKPTFINAVMTMAFGTSFAQILGVLAYPIITRIYSPEAFGVFTLFLSISSIIIIIASLRYEFSIMLPKTDGEAANLFALSIFLLSATSLLTLPLFWLEGSSIIRWLNAPDLAPYLPLISASVFVGSLYYAMYYWNSRIQRFNRISAAKITSSTAMTSMQLGAGLSGFAYGGSLIGANIFGNVLSVLFLGYHTWRDSRFLLREHLRWRAIIFGFKRYIQFPLYDTWSSLLSMIYLQLPAILLSKYFTAAVVGYYSLSLMVLQMPINLIGSAISQVFFQRAASAKHRSEEEVASLVKNTVVHLFALGIFPTLVLLINGRDLFVFVFGEPWAEAGMYSQMLALWIFIMFITSPVSPLFAIFEKQKYTLLFNGINLLTRGGALIAGGLIGSATISILLIAMISVLSYTVSNVWLMHIANVSIFQIMRDVHIYVLYCIPLLAIPIGVKVFFEPGILLTVALSAITISAYYGLIISREKMLQNLILSILKDSNLFRRLFHPK